MIPTLLAAAISGIVTGATETAQAPALHSDAGSVLTPLATVKLGDSEALGKHGCKGQNECKGQGGCKTDKNDCKGQNGCKGQGGCRTDGKPMPKPKPKPSK
jgi:hypothetical protein